MGTIYIIGLGPGDAGLITLDAFRLMVHARRLILRTAVHPSVAYLDEQHISYEALDHSMKKALLLMLYITILPRMFSMQPVRAM